MPSPLPPHPAPYHRGDLVRCACGNPFVARSTAAACGRCGGTDVSPLARPPRAPPFRL